MTGDRHGHARNRGLNNRTSLEYSGPWTRRAPTALREPVFRGKIWLHEGGGTWTPLLSLKIIFRALSLGTRGTSYIEQKEVRLTGLLTSGVRTAF